MTEWSGIQFGDPHLPSLLICRDLQLVTAVAGYAFLQDFRNLTKSVFRRSNRLRIVCDGIKSTVNAKSELLKLQRKLADHSKRHVLRFQRQVLKQILEKFGNNLDQDFYEFTNWSILEGFVDQFLHET